MIGATAWQPKDVVRIRQEFRVRPLTDEALLARLCELAAASSISGISAEGLVEAYHRQTGKCAMCQRPTTLYSVLLDDGNECTDWQLAYAPAAGLGHQLCAARAATGPEQSEQIKMFNDEKTKLAVAAKQMAKLAALPIIDDLKHLPSGGFGAAVELYERLKGLIRRANGPPASASAQWSDATQKTLLKRCHRKGCCDKWNPAIVMRHRRPFKIGQLDSNDYFDCYCPDRKTQEKDGQAPKQQQQPILLIPSPQVVAAESELAYALRRVRDLTTAGGCDVSPRLGEIAKETYAEHRRLQWLYNVSDLKVVFPAPAPPNSERQQWAYQSGKCIHHKCKKPLLPADPIHWDLYVPPINVGSSNSPIVWGWMHAGCNANRWAAERRLYYNSGEPPSANEHQKLYLLRHETNDMFDALLKDFYAKGSDLSKGADLLLGPLRERIANLAEQAAVQTRFALPELREEFHQIMNKYQEYDPKTYGLANPVIRVAGTATKQTFKKPEPKPKPKAKAAAAKKPANWRRRRKKMQITEALSPTTSPDAFSPPIPLFTSLSPGRLRLSLAESPSSNIPVIPEPSPAKRFRPDSDPFAQ